MKLIEIREGLCIAVDKIEAIEFTDGFSCKVYMTTGTSYDSVLPYQAIMSLLQQETENKTMKKLDEYLSVATIQTV